MAGETALNWVGKHRDYLSEVSDTIWDYAEVGFQEFKSSKLLADELEKAGFTVERAVAGLPTAFVATWGSGSPRLGFLAEYDALPGLSQKVTTHREPVKEGAPGHGCGHNIFGAGVMGAVIALKEEMKEDKLPGTIVFYGCPAEELLAGKVFMARAGLFDDLDCALTWHPMGFNMVSLGSMTAMNSVKFTFHGIPAHAAASPEQGRSALDAVELMDIGANYLREHVVQEARIHYVITNGGGEPNVVPPEAQVWYYVRAPKRKDVDAIFERLVKIADGAAMMTDTTYDMKFSTACYDVLPNKALATLLNDSMKKNRSAYMERR
ncbi:amidohydrolase [Coprothermobacter platensis]|uniref:amidohydrolase n=1 Tax=Coprothermobacter platensis TaxID=108819 RepID=UPI00036ED142|nr:amidohydrolase [Coprothermobacter platensis]